MKKKVTILFCLLLIFSGIFMFKFQENSYAEAVRNISGIVSLPNNEVAPAGGIKIMIHGNGDVGGYKSTNVTIAAGAKSVSYTLSLPQNIKDKAFRLSYNIQSEGNSYISSGYYGGTSYSEASWVDLSSNDIKNINIALSKGKRILGTISLPDKKVAPTGGVQMSINAYSDSKNVYTDTVIPAGKNSVSYTVCVPADAENQKWQIEYSIYSNGDGYVNDGYYGGNISPKPVDTKNGDVKDINITILKGKAISGKISLPNNEVAPSGGRRIYIYAENDNSDGEDTYVNTGDSIEIPAGKNFAQYTIYVPEDVKKPEWRVRYSLDFEGYVKEGYYGGNNYDSASLLSTAKGSVDGINITVIKGNAISGIVSLPNKEVASAKGMRISINAEGESGDNYSDVVISPGQNSASYTLYVPKDAKDQNWKVRYYINSNYPQYVKEGYYGGSSYESATLVNASSGNTKNINISLTKAKTILGNISLPNNEVAPTGGLKISVNASNSSGSGGNGHASVTIPAGKNSVSYEIGVSPNTKDTTWRISYNIQSNVSGYVSNGYYGGSDYSSAKLVDIASGDAKNINISLIKAKVIAGNISLPNNAVAPTGGISISVNASNNGGSGYANTYVTIPAGKNSVSYEIGVSPNAKEKTWKISYDIQSNVSGYVLNGYYGGNDYSSAKLVDIASGDAKNINISLTKAKTISGNISLPNNAVAPTGGMRISVDASNNNGSGYAASAMIPAGKNSVSYEIAVSPNAKDTTWRISYYINSNGSGYLSNGYYGGSDYSSAKLVDVASGDAKNINISLAKARAISGIISLPNNAVAPTGGIGISVNASNNSESGYTNVTIPAGKNSVSYEIGVSPNTKDTKWKISYSISSNVSGYVLNGYYGGSDYSSAKLVDIASGDAKNINISLIKAKVISGTISLPNNEVAPTGGIGISFNASNNSESGYTNVTIPAGKNSVSYEISVLPNTKDTKWKISYSIPSNVSGYVLNGYYGGSDYNSAKLVDIASGDAKNINISLIKAKVISGSISLPNNAVAPTGGIRISVNASNNSESGYTNVTIPAGKNSVSYEMSVSPNAKDTKWKISYSISSNVSGYVSNGYYGGSDYSSAKLVDIASGDAKNINISLIKAKVISGTISLPNNAVAPTGGINISVNASNNGGSGYANTNVTIPAGKNSVSYEMSVSPNTKDAKWKISYSIPSNVSGYVLNGYYGGSDYSSAKLVDVASGDAKNINIPLTKAKTISGSISLPNNAVAPTGGMRIAVNASSNGGSGYADVTIPEGKSSGLYEISVSPNAKDTTWRISYYINSNGSGYVLNGYYGGSDYSSAKLVDIASGDAKNINIALTKAKTISGNISLPNNAVAPAGGISIYVNASNSSGSGSFTNVIIPAGKNSVSYEMGVSPNTKDTKWKINYSIQSSGSEYVSNGYYGGSDYSSAKLVDIASGDAKNINIALTKAKTISGNISLPNNAVAPAGGMSIYVNASNGSESGSFANVIIPAGKNSVSYEVAVSPNTKDTKWKISYNIQSNGSQYVSNGYYGGIDYSSAKLVDVASGDAKNINIPLIKAKVISGNISLPNNAVAPTGGIDISVNASNNGASGSGYTSVKIPAGKNSVSYEMYVSPNTKDTKWKISYSIQSNVSGYVSYGYYGGSDYSSAKFVDVASGDAKNINISLIQANIISNNAVTGVTLSKTADVITVGGTDTLTATVAPATATNKNVIWTTSNSNVATVDKTGKITAVGAGTAKITVTTENGSKTSVCTVTVNPAIAATGVTWVRVSKPEAVLTVGGTDTLKGIVSPETATNKNVIWTTSNSNVATVDKTGKITAVGVGTAKITVTTEDGSKTSVCYVTVNQEVAVTGVTLNKTTDVLTVGGTDTLVATVVPATATNKNVIWTTSNSNVATVDKTGKVTAVGAGTAKITVTTENGSKTSVCNVTVNPAIAVTGVTGVRVSKPADVLTVGGTDTLTAIVAPATATNKNVIWTTSNSKVATVDKTGKITAVGVGTAKITVTTENGSKTSVCDVTVNPAIPVTGVTVSKK